MLLPLLIAITFAQNKCLRLPANTLCGSKFENLPVFDVSLQQLNDFITNQVINAGNVAKAMDSACPLAIQVVDRLRYQISMYCASRVNIGIQMNCSLDLGAPICLSECELAKSSFVNIIKNGTACPNGNAFSSVAEAHSAICDKARNLQNNCIVADADSNNCGFNY